MGWANADLLRSWSKAERSGDKVEKERLECLIDQSQAECQHPGESRSIRLCNRAGKYHGQRLVFCRRCAKILGTQ